MAKHGGSKYEPIRLQRHCDAIDAATAKEKSLAENEESALVLRNNNNDNNNSSNPSPFHTRHTRSNYPNNTLNFSNTVDLPTEVVGGVRVENSRPVNPRRRRRVAVKAPTARQARNPSDATRSKAGASTSTKRKRHHTRSGRGNAMDISSADDDDADQDDDGDAEEYIPEGSREDTTATEE
ncbi:MAG: hypothetical protein Q9216_003027, partial [Gyalolechia sp. 2 TL-2023]